jgi:alkylation response protein AidB-like acyl-CoA dehydrogenase
LYKEHHFSRDHRTWRRLAYWNLRARRIRRRPAGLPDAGAGGRGNRGRRGTSTVSATNSGQRDFDAYGSAQQKDWLTPALATCGAFCLTEPHVGSDASTKTTATKGPDATSSTASSSSSPAANGDVAIVIAVTEGAGKSMSAFIVPSTRTRLQRGPVEDKLGQHSSDTAQVTFD